MIVKYSSKGTPFTVLVKVAPLGVFKQSETKSVRLLVDTGATYTMMSKEILASLGTPVRGTKKLHLANGETIERDVGACEIFIENQWVPGLVIFGLRNDTAVLGANTLDEACLTVDTVNKKLIPLKALLV